MSEAADKQKAAKVPMWEGVIAYFPNALHAVAAISKMGSFKHNAGKMPTTWRQYEPAVYGNAMTRHLVDEIRDGLYDKESTFLHAGHAAWNALARLEKLLETYPLNGPEPRPKPEGTTAPMGEAVLVQESGNVEVQG